MGDSIDVEVLNSWIQRSYWDCEWSSYLKNVLSGTPPETEMYDQLKRKYYDQLQMKLQEIEAEQRLKHFHFHRDFNDHLRIRTERRTVLVCSACYGRNSEHVGTIEITVIPNNPDILPKKTGWFRECSVMKESWDYTDDMMMRAVEQLISNGRTDKWTLKVFITTSPSWLSADRIVEFCKKYNVDMTIICSSLYKTYQKEVKDGLRRLKNSTPNITLRIFTTGDWKDLNDTCKKLEDEIREIEQQQQVEQQQQEQQQQQETACLMGDSIDVKVIESWIQRSYWDRAWNSYLQNVLSDTPPESETYYQLKYKYDQFLRLRLHEIEAEKHLKDFHFHGDFNDHLRINILSRTVLVCSAYNDWIPEPVGTIEIHSLYGAMKTTGLFKNISDPYDYNEGGKKSKNHTEALLKRTVEELISNDKKTNKWILKVFMTTSPCCECADDIVEFCEEYNVDMTIICSSLYMIHQEEMQNGLRRLRNSTPNITLRIFTTEDWKDLDETCKRLEDEIEQQQQQQQQQQQKHLQQQTGEALDSNGTEKEGPSKIQQRMGYKDSDRNSPKKRKTETGSEDVIVIDDSD